MARKLLPVHKLREKTWHLMSQWTRRSKADPDGNVTCTTCPERGNWRKFHLGHFIHGHSKPTFLEPMNSHIQCFPCNHFKSGNLIVYYDFMLETYGKERVEQLKELSHKVIKFNRSYYEDLIKHYQSLLDGIPK